MRLFCCQVSDQNEKPASWDPCMSASSVTQSCSTLCEPMDCSPPGSSVHGILQQECSSRLPFPFPGDLSNPGIEPLSLASAALAGGFFTTAPSRKPNGISSSQNPDWKSCTVLFYVPVHAESRNVMQLNVSQKQSCCITAYSASQVVF